ncbi:MAG: ATP-binding protein [Proteobacteria bacterium]|nr:ATP-binding protein [Pseudomonadota bacterium]
MLLQRRAALRLRKLSLIYQDQQEHLQTTGTCGFLAGEVHSGGRVIVGTIAEREPPPWLDNALSAGGDTRLRAVGHESSWDVARASWVDRDLGICRIELDAPAEATHVEINPFGLTRLELAGEGSQQQALSRALENAILGKFASAGVHGALLGLSGDPLPNRHLGREAGEGVLRSDASVTAIWGPPGTGKTTLLVKWLLSLLEPGKEASWPSVLVTAPTHVAITKLVTDLLVQAGRLSEETVRYGSAERVRGSALEPVWHVRLLEGLNRNPGDGLRDSESWQRWAALLATREGREAAAKWLLGPRHIHVATCVGMARRDYALSNRTFDIAIVDEAGKAFGAELLLPASVARRVILVGDHNQLPPTITTDVLDEDIGYRLSMREVEELLRRNMFREVFEQLPPENKGMLTMQYRMHEDIGDAVGALFYDGRLESHRREREWALTSRRLVFVDFSKVQDYRHRRSRKSESIENPTERAALHVLLDRLHTRARDKRWNVLVVCPYEAQRMAVEQEIADARFAFDIQATTVDAVQGGEADVVILLMTRSGGRVQFLLDRHRLNVALSRARDAVVVLGHLGCLARDGEGPVAEFVRFGLERNTLDLVELPERANFKSHLGPRVVP